MKKLILSCLLLVIGTGLFAQFSRASLQASGLTCALCTKAINKSLEQLSFVNSVKADIKTSSFLIEFKQGAAVDIDALRKGVEDAGFSVAKLQLTGNFEQMAVAQDAHAEFDGKTFHFLGVKKQVLDGEQVVTIVDKNFLPAKEFRKYSKTTSMTCVETGRMDNCCTKGGQSKGGQSNHAQAGTARIYHLTL